MTDQNKPGTTPEQSATPDANDGGGDGNNNGNAPITQELVNKLVGQARTEGRDAAVKALLAELGAESPDQIKALLKEKEDLEAAKLTEQEKLQKQLKKLADDLAAATEREQAARAESVRVRTQSAVFTEAAKPEYNIRPDALNDVWQLIDRSLITINDKDEIVGVADAVKALAENKPWLLNTGAAATTARSVPAAVPITPNGKTPSQGAAHDADKQKRHRSAVRRLLG